MLINAVLGQSLSAMWAMVNTLQLINYFAVCTLFYPKIVLAMFSFINIVNLENEYLSKAYLVHIDESQLEGRDSWDYRFANQGIESTDILLNCADIFFSVLLLVLYYVAVVLLSLLCTNIPVKVGIHTRQLTLTFDVDRREAETESQGHRVGLQQREGPAARPALQHGDPGGLRAVPRRVLRERVLSPQRQLWLRPGLVLQRSGRPLAGPAGGPVRVRGAVAVQASEGVHRSVHQAEEDCSAAGRHEGEQEILSARASYFYGKKNYCTSNTSIFME